MTFKKYIEDVKSQLYCNATDDYKKEHITYMHSIEEIDNNLDYFKECKKSGLSPYKALLYFFDYLDEKNTY